MVRGPFYSRRKGSVVEVWLGDPDHPESEVILAVDERYLPALIATLKAELES